jgi:hypothetical protein
MQILMMATYPWNMPRHGGQHRLYNIEYALKCAGHTVECIGVLGSPHYSPSPGFLEYPGDKALSHFLPYPALMEDWAISQLYLLDRHYFNFLFSQVSIAPDIILIEQPWLFNSALEFAKSLSVPPKLIYGSQNIEFKLKYDMAKLYFGESIANDYRKKIYEAEKFAFEHADLVSCVSVDDKQWMLENWGRDSILAKNGVIDRKFDVQSIRESNRISQAKKFALYCASAHPPNIDGFFEIFGGGIGCFSPEERLIVAGGAGANIRNAPQFSQIPGLSECYIDAGQVSEECLGGLLNSAHACILPITYGGGTNLKSAEAIWTGAHIVATPTAMRGLDDFLSAPGLNVATDGQAFKTAIREVMRKPKLRISEYERNKRKAVLWESTLSDLVNAIGRMGQ